ncbi:hypothetical protein LOTGIDRAFT_234809 [Lottia gigantea]|uniref:Protein kinase domain-containing protein n=1 Tax=Lottia gigantea TaxID=225164 RepID=V4A467_LOTGI|nr:hypothetical protein LOTGIDRAFT_234809 [Lottia gigantea]ESO88041.1 hypothetical protein LOTGIDRAFT_234809 [Lottia gigantea]
MAANFPMEISAVSEQHSVVSLMSFIESLGYFSKIDLPAEDFYCQLISNVNMCLTTCFHQLIPYDITITTQSSCQICCIIKALVHHFANCIQKTTSCSVCLQLFRLLQGHVGFCQNDKARKKESTSDICYVLLEAMDFENFDEKSHMFWVRSKKLLAEIEAVPNSESLSQVLKKEQFSHLNANEINESDLFGDRNQSNFHELEEMEQLYGDAGYKIVSQSEFSKGNNSIEKNNGDLEGHILDLRDNTSDISSIFTPTVLPMFDPNSTTTVTPIAESFYGIGAKPKDSLRRKVSRMSSGESKLCELPETQIVEDFKSSSNNSMKSNQSNEDRKLLEIPNEIDVGLPPQVKRNLKEYNATQDSCDTQKTYGESRVTSLPMDPSYRGGDQFCSLEMRPVGQPGVGEVVYGTREQLRLVAHYWSKLKNTLKDTTTLPQQKREEGVILSKYKKQLKILRTLYQKHYQWERLTHLGNGAAGQCHLAKDLNTDFQFCVKRLIIHRYEEQELKIWCDLKHDNIVHLFGALRRGEKIYILAEFIDGGSLTDCINAQKRLNRRISHVMALTYLRQLLEVLRYLQSRGILHEDIKCDNILLRAGSTSIAVCDFGLARYINQKKDFKGQSPAGTSTQWSPEKAASDGHGFPSEVWAAICVLVHMMSGDPPWMKRFHSAAMLHFIIYEKSPPLEDVPDSVRSDMKDFIRHGFTRSDTDRPTAEQLLAHPIFTHTAQEIPERYFSLLTERPPLAPASSNPDELNAIVQNLQLKIDEAEKQQQNSEGSVNTVQVNSQTISSVVTSGSVSVMTQKIDVARAVMNQTTYAAPGLNEIYFPMVKSNGGKDGNFNNINSNSESVECRKSLMKTAGFEVGATPQSQTILESHNNIRTSNVMLKQTFVVPGKNEPQTSSLATGTPSEVSLQFRIKPEIVEASARLTEMPSANLNKLTSNDLPKLSILEKISFEEQTNNNSLTCPKFSLLEIKSVGLDDQGHDNHAENLNGNKQNSTYNGSNLKSSHSVPEIYSSKTSTTFKSCLCAPNELCNVDPCTQTYTNSSFSELHDKLRTTNSSPQTSISHFSNNIFPPSISELHNRLNVAPENNTPMHSTALESSETSSVEELYANFLNDSVQPNLDMLQKAPLNEYREDETSPSTSKGSETLLPNLPIFSKEHMNNNLSVSGQSNHFGAKLPNKAEVSISQPIVTVAQQTGNPNNTSSNEKPQRSPQIKHKSSLHININQPAHHLIVANFAQDTFKSAPIGAQVSPNRKNSSKTAEPRMAGESGLWGSSPARSSTSNISASTRSSEYDEERDKLLQQLKYTADTDFPEQDERTTELGESDIGLLEQQKLIAQSLQNNIHEPNGTAKLNFYDEDEMLICSVKASPTIKDWKELFDASPIIQKIQDKNIIHFKIQVLENGQFISVDYTSPIDKYQTNLTVSPTTPDDHNCWCDSHLSV